MFKLKYLEVGPFRSLVEPQRIEFPENGMVLIEGINKDTKGSSGSGKTNLLLAIEYAFGSCPLPSTVLSSWQQSDSPPTVKLGIDTDKGLLQLNRSKKLELIENAVTFNGSAVQKEEQLLKRIGLSSEVRQALTYRGQRSPGLFLNKTNMEKGDFLIPLLDLIRFEKATATGESKVKELDEKKARAEAAYEAIESSLITYDEEDKINELERSVTRYEVFIKMGEEEITSFKSDFEKERSINLDQSVFAKMDYEVANHLTELETELKELQSNKPVFNLDNRELVKLSDTLVECNARLAKIKAEDQAKLAEYNKSMNEKLNIIQTNRIEISKGPKLRKELDKLDSEIKALKSNKCPTCDREWILAQVKLTELESKKNNLILEIHLTNEIEKETKLLEELYHLIPPFVADMNTNKLQLLIDDFKDKIATEKQKLNSAKTLFEAKHAKQIVEAREKVLLVQISANKVAKEVLDQFIPIEKEFNSKIQALQSQKAELQSKLSTVKVELATLLANKKTYENSQKQLQQKLTEKKAVEAELYIESDILSLIGREGFLGSIFDEILDEISTETNNTLAAIANTSHVTLEFKSESLSQKGTVKKSIIPVVTVGDFTAPIKSALSGGMLSTVELAVDLAVMNVISRNTGVVPGYLMLDECFEGMDNISKATCFELLRMYSKDRLILIIDHSSEMKAQFSQIITITLEDGCSTVTSVV